MEGTSRIEFCDEEAAFRLLVGVVRQAHHDMLNKWGSTGHKAEAAEFLARLQGTSPDKVVARRQAIIDKQPKSPPRRRRGQQEEDWY